MLKRVSVALPVPLNKLFDYNIEVDGDDYLIGCRVIVPFGAKNKFVGVILEVSPNPSDELKKVIRLMDGEPIFSEVMIKFLKWMATYYFAPIGDVFSNAIPSSTPTEVKHRVRLLINPAPDYLESIKKKSPKLYQVLRLIIESTNDLTAAYISNIVGSNISSQLNKLVEKGIVGIYEEELKEAKVKQAKFIRINPDLFESKELLEEEIKRIEKKTPKRALLINMLRISNPTNEFIKQSKLAERFAASPAVIKGLIDAEFLVCEMMDDREDDDKDKEFKLANRKEIDLNLTDEQTFVLDAINEKIDEKNLKPSLLYGVTGSGKTLIYMHLIKRMLDADKSVIIILPEISLTPQLIDRFELSFPGLISVIHSRISQNEREKSWADIRSGKTRIVIGARSAIFAPCNNLGLIIVDEEHDSSFKQDAPNPRYNGRDAALVRAKMENAHIILGSATPSIESMNNAIVGKFDLYQIKHRADGAMLPIIKTIDMISAKKAGQVYKNLSKQLLTEIEARLDKHEGVILFQNRRGFSSYLQCEDCGFIHECPNCSVKLTYHKFKSRLKCHYCGHTQPAYNACTNCGSVQLAVKGSGTQMIEEELLDYFAESGRNCNLERMDSDTTAKKGSHRKILERFATGETDILIGTQMVAKGLDFPRVTLVGIVNADQQLMMQDFRAGERTFQILTQVAGRAGRSAEKQGEVFIQTTKPEDMAIAAVRAASYNFYFENELRNRAEAIYPPYSRFIIIEISSLEQDLAIKHIEIFHKLIKSHQANIVFQPTAPGIERIREYYRRIIVIKNIKKYDPNGNILRAVIGQAYQEYQNNYATPKIRIKIDIDAYNSL